MIGLSEFRHLGEHGGGDHRTDAGNGLEPFGFARQFGVLGDEGGDGFVTLGDLFLQGFDELPGLAHPERIGVMLGVVTLADEQWMSWRRRWASSRPVAAVAVKADRWRQA